MEAPQMIVSHRALPHSREAWELTHFSYQIT